MDAPARIAARLVRLVEIEQTLGRLDQDARGVVDLKLPISQEELGQWAGLGREGAVKGLRTLRSPTRGDELVHIFVETPTRLTARQRELLEAFAEESDTTVSPVTKGFLDKLRDLFE